MQTELDKVVAALAGVLRARDLPARAGSRRARADASAGGASGKAVSGWRGRLRLRPARRAAPCGCRTARSSRPTITSAKSIYPDIVVHQRDDPRTICSRSRCGKPANHQPPEHDRHKLRALTDPHLWFAYWIGVYLMLGRRTSRLGSLCRRRDRRAVVGVAGGPAEGCAAGVRLTGRDRRPKPPHANSASGISRASRARNGASRSRMVAPFADRRRIDRAAHLHGACGCRRCRAFVKSQDLVVPGKSDKADETAARGRLIPDDVLVVDFQQHIRRQASPANAAKAGDRPDNIPPVRSDGMRTQTCPESGPCRSPSRRPSDAAGPG